MRACARTIKIQRYEIYFLYFYEKMLVNKKSGNTKGKIRMIRKLALVKRAIYAREAC